MSMRKINIEKLVEWLGSDGAIAELEKSNLTVSKLYDMAVQNFCRKQNKVILSLILCIETRPRFVKQRMSC